jgi:hypothetical protein
VNADVSHVPQAVKLSMLGAHGAVTKSAAIHVTEPTPVKFAVLSTGARAGGTPSLNVHVLGQFDAVAQPHTSGRYNVVRASSNVGKISVVKLHDNNVLIEQLGSMSYSHCCTS